MESKSIETYNPWRKPSSAFDVQNDRMPDEKGHDRQCLILELTKTKHKQRHINRYVFEQVPKLPYYPHSPSVPYFYTFWRRVFDGKHPITDQRMPALRQIFHIETQPSQEGMEADDDVDEPNVYEYVKSNRSFCRDLLNQQAQHTGEIVPTFAHLTDRNKKMDRPTYYQQMTAFYHQPRTRNSGIVWHDMGTGKTWTLWLIVDLFIRTWWEQLHAAKQAKIKLSTVRPKRRIILVYLREEHKTNWLEKLPFVPCVLSEYSALLWNNAKPGVKIPDVRWNVKELKCVQLVSVHAFMDMVQDITSYDTVLVDEAHLLSDPDVSKPQLAQKYWNMYRALSKARNQQRFKTVLLTGTPIRFKLHRVGALLNLVHAKNVFPSGQESRSNPYEQMFDDHVKPTPVDADLEKKFAALSQKDFFALLRGLISYISIERDRSLVAPIQKQDIMIQMNDVNDRAYLLSVVKLLQAKKTVGSQYWKLVVSKSNAPIADIEHEFRVKEEIDSHVPLRVIQLDSKEWSQVREKKTKVDEEGKTLIVYDQYAQWKWLRQRDRFWGRFQAYLKELDPGHVLVTLATQIVQRINDAMQFLPKSAYDSWLKLLHAVAYHAFKRLKPTETDVTLTHIVESVESMRKRDSNDEEEEELEDEEDEKDGQDEMNENVKETPIQASPLYQWLIQTVQLPELWKKTVALPKPQRTKYYLATMNRLVRHASFVLKSSAKQIQVSDQAMEKAMLFCTRYEHQKWIVDELLRPYQRYTNDVMMVLQPEHHLTRIQPNATWQTHPSLAGTAIFKQYLLEDVWPQYVQSLVTTTSKSVKIDWDRSPADIKTLLRASNSTIPGILHKVVQQWVTSSDNTPIDVSITSFLLEHGDSFTQVSSRKETEMYAAYLPLKINRFMSIVKEAEPTKHWIYSRSTSTLSEVAKALTAANHHDAWSTFMEYIRSTDRTKQLYSYMNSSKRATAYLIGGVVNETVRNQPVQVTLPGVLLEWFRSLVPAESLSDSLSSSGSGSFGSSSGSGSAGSSGKEEKKEGITPMYVYLCATDRCHADGIPEGRMMQWQAIDRCMLTLFNDPSNMHGVKIRFLLGSRAYRESISLSETLWVHLMEPQTSSADEDQITKRAVRFRSIQDSMNRYVTRIRYVFSEASESSKSKWLLTTDQSNMMDTQVEQVQYDTWIQAAKETSILCPVDQRVSAVSDPSVQCLFIDDEEPPEDPSIEDGQITRKPKNNPPPPSQDNLWFYNPRLIRRNGLVDNSQSIPNIHNIQLETSNHPKCRWLLSTHPDFRKYDRETIDTLTVEFGSAKLLEYQRLVQQRATMPKNVPTSVQSWYNGLCQRGTMTWPEYQKAILDINDREQQWLSDIRSDMNDEMKSNLDELLACALRRDTRVNYTSHPMTITYMIWLRQLFDRIMKDKFPEIHQEYFINDADDGPLRIQFNVDTSQEGDVYASTSVSDQSIVFTFWPLVCGSAWCIKDPQQRFLLGRKVNSLEHMMVLLLEHEMCHMIVDLLFTKWMDVNDGHHALFGQLCTSLFLQTYYSDAAQSYHHDNMHQGVSASACTVHIGDRVMVRNSDLTFDPRLTGVVVYKDIWGEYAHVQLDVKENQAVFVPMQHITSGQCVEIECNSQHPIVPYVQWNDLKLVNKPSAFSTNMYPMGGWYIEQPLAIRPFDRLPIDSRARSQIVANIDI
jgi:hypothetical protein